MPVCVCVHKYLAKTNCSKQFATILYEPKRKIAHKAQNVEGSRGPDFGALRARHRAAIIAHKLQHF